MPPPPATSGPLGDASSPSSPMLDACCAVPPAPEKRSRNPEEKLENLSLTWPAISWLFLASVAFPIESLTSVSSLHRISALAKTFA